MEERNRYEKGKKEAREVQEKRSSYSKEKSTLFIFFLFFFPLQAEYEVTPDEKRKESGQELIDKYFNPKVNLPDLFKIIK